MANLQCYVISHARFEKEGKPHYYTGSVTPVTGPDHPLYTFDLKKAKIYDDEIVAQDEVDNTLEKDNTPFSSGTAARHRIIPINKISTT